MGSGTVFLEKSLNNARWMLASADEDDVGRMVQQSQVPELVARLLSGRGVKPEQAQSFLNPTLANDFPDPFSLKDMDELADFLAKSIKNGRKIGVFADFDVDGATSSSVLLRFLRYCGQNPPFYIPDRLKEGYGPNIGAFQTLKEQGSEIVLICDCGITAFEPIEQGRALGLDLVVLDHHEAEDSLPKANFVINPKRKDDESGLDMLAACGVVFMLCVAVNNKLRESGFYEDRGLAEAPLKKWLDVVALGTVCDMVPLQGVNRLFVRAGLTQIARHENSGLSALCQVSGIDGVPSTYHFGFALGPRINAGSRVHQADLGARLLSCDDPEEAKNIAWILNDCNEKRKGIQSEMMDHAIKIVEEEGLHENPIIIAGHESWHPGLSGLVAGRLKEKYGKPAVCITYAPGETGGLEGRGSGRSVIGVNMGGAFIAARNEGLLVKGGGHAMAAGFTLLPEKLNEFSEFLYQNIEEQLSGEEILLETDIDAVLSVRGATVNIVKMLEEQAGPFGQGQPEPMFVLQNVRVHDVDIVGKDHVKCMVSDWEGGGRLKAIAFQAKDMNLGQALLSQNGAKPFHLAGSLKLNHWNGRDSVEMHISDGAFGR